jgi:excisionase family DNA binding protein
MRCVAPFSGGGILPDMTTFDNPSAAMSKPAPATTTPIEPLTVTVREAQRLTGLGCSTLYKLMAAGTLTRRKIGSRTLIVFQSLKQLLALESESAL